jgi:hypothetical protein
VGTRRRHDVLWIEYERMPFLPALVEHLLLRGGPPRVIEYDDAVFHRYDRACGRLGAAGRAHVEAHYALQRTAPLVADVLRRAAGGATSCAA